MGEKWFLKQGEELQRGILVPAKYSAWKNNLVKLNGLSEEYPAKSAKSPFGRYPHEKSLSKALGLQQAERWYFYPKDENWDYESMRSHLVAEWVEGSIRTHINFVDNTNKQEARRFAGLLVYMHNSC